MPHSVVWTSTPLPSLGSGVGKIVLDARGRVPWGGLSRSKYLKGYKNAVNNEKC